MAVSLLTPGHTHWSGEIGDDGHRTYRVTFRVYSDTGYDGPANVFQCPGVPNIGTYWLFGGNGVDVDVWAFRTPRSRATPEVDGEINHYWLYECTFATRPPGTPGDRKSSRCQDGRIEDPLLEPMKISGSFAMDKVEATFDRYGRAILSSSHERLRGNLVEFDESSSIVTVEQNVPDLQLPLITQLNNRLNDVPMWGLPARSIKCNVKDWRKVYYGLCSYYYTRVFELHAKTQIDHFTGAEVGGWDRYAPDEGNKVLNGEWDTATGAWVLKDVGGSPPDPDNPSHFKKFTDREGNPMHAILDGNGLPAETNIGTSTSGGYAAGRIYIEKYKDANLFLLGLPVTL